MTGWIAIALGDFTGIGAEVTLKALAQETTREHTRYLLIGDIPRTFALHDQLGLNLPLEPYNDGAAAGPFALYNPLAEALPASLKVKAGAAGRGRIGTVSPSQKIKPSCTTNISTTRPHQRRREQGRDSTRGEFMARTGTPASRRRAAVWPATLP